MNTSPKIAGDIDAYEFYVEVMLHFRCDGCTATLECPVLDSDEAAPNPPWSTREGARGLAAGWWVPPLTTDGSVQLVCFCPVCAQERGLIISREQTI